MNSRRRIRDLPRWIRGAYPVAPHEHADASHALALLRPRREWPRRSTSEPCDELPPPHQHLSCAFMAAYSAGGLMGTGLEALRKPDLKLVAASRRETRKGVL
jgi:hypothetical protein